MVNLTYVSACRIAADEHASAIAALITQARTYNEGNDVTGGLLFTGSHFVQTLEGVPATVDALMAQIEKDPRHTVLRIIDRRKVATRNFTAWLTDYRGPSLYVSRIVSQAVGHLATQADIERLLRMMREFALPLPPGL